MNDLVLCLCGRVHFAEKTSIGTLIPCPEMPSGELWFVNTKYIRFTGPAVYVPRPEVVW